MTIPEWIFLIAVILVLSAWSAEQEQKRKRREAADEMKKHLTRYATPDILAYGLPDPQNGVVEQHPAVANNEPDDPLIDLERGKWSMLNAGRLLGAVLSTPGSVTISREKDGRVKLEGVNGNAVELTPFVLENIHVTRPNQATAILSYLVRSGYMMLQATAIWVCENGKWRTSAYSATRR